MNKWEFYTYSPQFKWALDYVLIACDGDGGYIMKKNGTIEKKSSSYNLERARHSCICEYWNKINEKEALNLINEEARKKVASFLKLDKKEIILTNEKNKELFKLLALEGAFNGDTAYLAKDNEVDYFDKMADEKLVLISPLNSCMFYLKEKGVDKLD